MNTFLTLSEASILESVGFGTRVKSAARFKIVFEKKGIIAVHQTGLLGQKGVFLLNIAQLELRAWTTSVHTGGGFIGGGFGAVGAVEGMVSAALLNKLTKRTHEYSLLGAFCFMPDGSERHIIFGFRNLSESNLRQALFSAIPLWTDDFVDYYLGLINKSLSIGQIEASFAEIDNMKSRGMLSFEQHSKLEAALSAFGKRRSAVIANPPPVERVSQLSALASMRQSGALTEQEFQREKSRLLNA